MGLVQRLKRRPRGCGLCFRLPWLGSRTVMKMRKMKCLYAFDQPGVQGAKAFWVANFKNKPTFIVNQLTEKRAPNGAVYININIFV